MHIRKIHPEELAWVNAQYSDIDFAPSSETDLIVVAEINGVKAGSGRIVRIENHTGELGGIYVLPEFRGHGVAAQIVEFLLEINELPTLFCIPFSHLDKFYQRFGFLPVDSTTPLPPKIAEKINWCGKTYEASVAALCRITDTN